MWGCSSPLELTEATCLCRHLRKLTASCALICMKLSPALPSDASHYSHWQDLMSSGAVLMHFLFFILFTLACKLWLYSVSLMSFQQGGPRLFCLSSHSSCSIPSLNLLQLHYAFSQVQRPKQAKFLIV